MCVWGFLGAFLYIFRGVFVIGHLLYFLDLSVLVEIFGFLCDDFRLGNYSHSFFSKDKGLPKNYVPTDKTQCLTLYTV